METNEGSELSSSQEASSQGSASNQAQDSSQASAQQSVENGAQPTQDATQMQVPETQTQGEDAAQAKTEGERAQDAQAQTQEMQQAATQTADVQQAQSAAKTLPTSGLAIAGMVLGIVALVLVFIPVVGFIAPLLAIVGLILSIVGLQGVNKGKKGGKGIAIAGIVTCAVAALITLLLTVACSSFLGSLTSNNASDSKFVGTWDCIEATVDKRTYTEKELEQARKSGNDSYFVFEKDGKAYSMIGNTRTNYTWESVDSSSLYLINQNGNKNLFKLNGDVLSTSGIKLRKGQPRSSSASASSSSSSSSASSSSSSSSSSAQGDVNPELKEFLDSYEAFADDYVDFMQRYKESGNSMSMMQDYTNMLQRYSDFSSKLSSWEKKAKSMSAADAAYYAEVSARVSKKLLAVL